VRLGSPEQQGVGVFETRDAARPIVNNLVLATDPYSPECVEGAFCELR